jgi:hypothetical protein
MISRTTVTDVTQTLLYLMVQTRFAEMPIGHTGFRPVEMR